MASALIVDDERDICDLIEMGLMAQEVNCESAYNTKSAIKKLKERHYDVVFCDVRLPDGDGLDLLAHIQKRYPNTPVCMITAHGNMDMAIRALKLGAFDFVNKPFELKQLRAICRSALHHDPDRSSLSPEVTENARARDERQLHRQVQLIGDAPVMQKVRKMISKVARSQAPVFIYGESGTGKEVAARSIHDQSSRHDGPFIAVNCGAIPENLVESEFFGYKKGAFTGANQDADGLFVAANNGTLFLDEVADLPLAMQVKLLRAIQERAVRPIGGGQEEPVDVRIISATHHDLVDKVKKEEFREDLYYRLNVIGITMPPLREREGDVLVLARHLLKRLSERGGYVHAKLSGEARKKLSDYTFTGNVRELENVLERALTFMEGNTIEAGDIDFTLGLQHRDDAATKNEDHPEETPVPVQEQIFWENAAAEEEAPADHGEDGDSLDVEECDAPRDAAYGPLPPCVSQSIPQDLEQFLQNLERKLLLKALRDCDNNKTKAAKSLGINFRAMRYKLKKLGID